MYFSDILNEYIEKVSCSNRELSEISGISAETIARYKRGERIPRQGSSIVRQLAQGIESFGKNSGINVSAAEIEERLNSVLGEGINVDSETYTSNLNLLADYMEITRTELAKNLNYDPSYISRVFSGKRKPSDMSKFNYDIAVYAAQRLFEMEKTDGLEKILGCSRNDIDTKEKTVNAVYKWIGNNRFTPVYNNMNKFLNRLDEFDLDDYIKAIKFDKIKIPTSPFRFPSSKRVTGLKNMMDIEMDFIRSVLLSKSEEDMIMYSDMPMDKMAKDEEFAKKWMFGMAMLLKKGLHLNMIHEVSRPIDELMLGLESFIPMYMTGQISPYYIEEKENNVFLHLLKVSGTVALTGEAINGYHEDGFYYMTNNKEEVKYFRQRAKQMLSKTKPLMDIYTEKNSGSYKSFYNSVDEMRGERKYILSQLPVYTLSDELLMKILSREGTGRHECEVVRRYIHDRRKKMTEILSRGDRTEIEIPVISKDIYDHVQMKISFPGLFLKKEFICGKDEYLEHLRETKGFFEGIKNCELKRGNSDGFRNINILIIRDKLVIVSKMISPAIHFAIYHPRMIKAFEDFAFPITDMDSDTPDDTYSN